MSDTPGARLLRMRDLEAKLQMHRATIYRMIAAGEFPRARQVGKQAVAWLESEVDAWIAALPVAGDDTRAA